MEYRIISEEQYLAIFDVNHLPYYETLLAIDIEAIKEVCKAMDNFFIVPDSEFCECLFCGKSDREHFYNCPVLKAQSLLESLKEVKP